MSHKVAIIAANGGKDAAYKVLNIATAAAAMGDEVAVFFTFEGLNLIHKQMYKNLQLPAGMAGMEGAFKANNVPESRSSRPWRRRWASSSSPAR